MKRVLLFVLLAGGGLAALVVAAGGLSGTRRDADAPAVALPVEQATRTQGAPVDMKDLPGARPDGRGAPTFDVEPVRAVSWTVKRSVDWVDPITKRRVTIPAYVQYSVACDELAAQRTGAATAPGARWSSIHVTVYRDPTTLAAKDVDDLLADPATRKALVQYEIDADEGTANMRLDALGDGDKPVPPKLVVRLTKNVRVHVVADDVDIRTSNLVIDEAAGTVEGDGDLLVEGPAFTANGNGLRLDRTSGRIEILRHVEVNARPLNDDRARPPALDVATAEFRPRLLRTVGSVVLVRHEVDRRHATYEAILTDDVRVEAEDGSELDAARVVLEMVPRDDAGAAPAAPAKGAAKGVASTLPAARGRWRLRTLTAEGAVRVRREQRASAAGAPKARAAGAGRALRVTIETERLTARFDEPDRSSATLEGPTTLRYEGELGMPGSRSVQGTVTARCRDRVTYGPPVDAAEKRACDIVVDLVGAVEIDGTLPPTEGSERLQAERVRLLLRRIAPPPAPATTGRAVAATPPREGSFVAVAFAASGGDVRIGGPVVSGRAREIRAFDLDRPDGWHLLLSGPDARLAIAEDAATPRRATDDPPGATTREAGTARARRAWMPDHLDAVGDVRGSLAPRPGDRPVAFEADALGYTEVDGGELRASDGHRARLTYPGLDGRDQSVTAPRVGFRVGDDATTMWTRGGTTAQVWTGMPARPTAPATKGRRVVTLRGGAVLEVTAGITPAKERAITVAARDGGSFESLVDGASTDRLDATSIVVTLVERARNARRPAAARPGATGTPAAARTPAAAGPPTPPTRWTLACETIDVEVASTGAGFDALRSFAADGGVSARSDPQPGGAAQRFDGRRLTLRADGSLHRGRLEGTPEKRAELSAVDDLLPQAIRAPAVDFVLDDVSLVSATFAPPVAGLFHAVDAHSKRVVRFALKSTSGPLVIARDGAAKDGRATAVVTGTEADPVVVARSIREGADGPFGPAARLASPRIDLETTGALGVAGATIRRFTASGPGTRIDAGTTRATGRTLTYDGATSIVRIEGPEGVYVERTGFRGRARWFTYNLLTDTSDSEGPQASVEVGK